MAVTELGKALRGWRDRLEPATVGLPANGIRRAAGLRREELAALAGLSADYVTRLEQGRSTSPSVQVLTSLARALRLSADETDYLFRIAGQQPPQEGRIRSRLTPGAQRILDRLNDTPVSVVDAAWNVVAWNQPWAALMGDPSAYRGRERNVLWRHFAGGDARAARPQARIVRSEESTREFEVSAAADLRAAVAKYPDDPNLARLISELRRASPRFADLWKDRCVAVNGADHKSFDHPQIGLITVDCDVLLVQDADLRVIVYTAAPGTPDADKLALLRVIGLQSMDEPAR